MILKLPFAIKDLLPGLLNCYTPMEALIDLLTSGYERTQTVGELADRWAWSNDDVQKFLDEHRHFFNEDIYEEEDTAPVRRQRAQEIVDIYNEVFDRKCELNESRIRTINARIKEGRKMKPPIGPAQFKAVFEFKKKEWTGTEQEKYLTLETLCRPTHFLNYLEAARLAYIKEQKQKTQDKEGVKISGTLFKANG